MEQPLGFKVKGKEHLVLRFLRAIYGLKQAARVWWIELDRSLKEFGFKHLYSDAGIFVAQHPDGTLVILLAYIDDIILVAPTSFRRRGSSWINGNAAIWEFAENFSACGSSMRTVMRSQGAGRAKNKQKRATTGRRPVQAV